MMNVPDWLPNMYRPSGPEVTRRAILVEPLLKPIIRFLKIEAAGGMILLACTLLALYLANSPWAARYAEIWQTRLGFTIGDFTLYKPLLLWINDGLMTIFFFLVGLEIKREIIYGELRDPRKAALPIAAALGGMVAPALIYLLFHFRQPAENGWGIPMATDIAFVVGFLVMLGKRVPLGLKILLLTLAIVDDIGAIVVIAIAYSSNTEFSYLFMGVGGFALIYFLRWIGVRPIPIYVLLGALVWLAFLKSGVHPTVAGVILGLLTPASPWFSEKSLIKVAEGVIERLQQERQSPPLNHHDNSVQILIVTARETISPLDRLETALHPWVAFVIMPIFGLANAGVKIELPVLTDPISLAVAAGLVFGKPIGIVLFSWLAVRLGIARLPFGVNWKTMVGAGCMAGIGFTMSLFIAGLALDDEHLSAGKVGTLLGSSISTILGLALLYIFLRPVPHYTGNTTTSSPSTQGG